MLLKPWSSCAALAAMLLVLLIGCQKTPAPVTPVTPTTRTPQPEASPAGEPSPLPSGLPNFGALPIARTQPVTTEPEAAISRFFSKESQLILKELDQRELTPAERSHISNCSATVLGHALAQFAVSYHYPLPSEKRLLLYQGLYETARAAGPSGLASLGEVLDEFKKNGNRETALLPLQLMIQQLKTEQESRAHGK